MVAQCQHRRSQFRFFRGVRIFYDAPGKCRQRIRKVVVAVQSGNFFDQVNLSLYVKPPGWNASEKFGRRAGFRNQFESETIQDRDDLVYFELRAKDAFYLRGAYLNRCLLHLPSYSVYLPVD